MVINFKDGHTILVTKNSMQIKSLNFMNFSVCNILLNLQDFGSFGMDCAKKYCWCVCVLITSEKVCHMTKFETFTSMLKLQAVMLS